MRVIVWLGNEALELRARGDSPGEASVRVLPVDAKATAARLLRVADARAVEALLRRAVGVPSRVSLALRLADALRLRRVTLWRRRGRAPTPSTGEGTDPDETPPLEAVREEKTWIEIELLDMDGNPMPGERYAITLPDGTVREGALDAHGRAYFGGLDPGSAEIRWPDRDGDATAPDAPLGQSPTTTSRGSDRGGPSRHERHWIELELLDMDGAPVPHERYWIRLPDGTVREGALDAEGRAYFDDLDPGQCEIRWVSRDGEATALDPDATAPSPSDPVAAQVETLLNASRDGSAFCQECERARQELEASETQAEG
jgi:protocatechuate 3,4-dioxygenase beta subunit